MVQIAAVAANGKRVLLLEDDSDLRELIECFLSDNGYVVSTVPDGRKGLDRLAGERFDAIVCDLMMPGMPGDAFQQEVEARHPDLAKRFLFLTGHSDHPEIASFIRRSGNRVLYKPISTSDLLDGLAMIASGES